MEVRLISSEVIVKLQLNWWEANTCDEQVYKDQTNVDDYLVQSIVQPTQDPNAGEVYYRLDIIY